MLNIFVVYVENKPGVLTRVASLFRRRAFNIDSLTVGHTEKPEVSRMTIMVDTNPDQAQAHRGQSLQPGERAAGREHHPRAGDRPRPGHDQGGRDPRSALARAGTGQRVPRPRGGCRAGIAHHRNHRRRRQDRRPAGSAASLRRGGDGPHRHRRHAARHDFGHGQPGPDQDTEVAADEGVSYSV